MAATPFRIVRRFWVGGLHTAGRIFQVLYLTEGGSLPLTTNLMPPVTLWAIFDDSARATHAVDEVEDSSAVAVAEVHRDSGTFSNHLLRVADTSEAMGDDVQSQFYAALSDGASLMAIELAGNHEAVMRILRKHGGPTMHWQKFAVPSESQPSEELPEDWGTHCRRCDRRRAGWLRRLWSFEWFECPHCKRRYCRSCFRSLEVVYARDDSNYWTRACLECDGEISESYGGRISMGHPGGR